MKLDYSLHLICILYKALILLKWKPSELYLEAYKLYKEAFAR